MSKDLTGMRTGILTVVGKAANNGSKKETYWLCQCDCGNTKEIIHNTLVRTNRPLPRSCGCLTSGFIRASRTKHSLSTSEDLETLRTYQLWKRIKRRCYGKLDPSYKNYGGRGISMAAEWLDDPESFCNYIRENLGERPEGYSLDRINNDGNYEPGNLRWADCATQLGNRRVQKGSRTIDQFTLDGTFIARHKNFSDALRYIGREPNTTTLLKQAATRENNVYSGYRWKLVD